MPRCRSCASLLAHDAEFCPHCSTPIGGDVPSGSPQDGASSLRDEPPPIDGKLVPIARFTNVAEAGFFCHELMYRLSIPVRMAAEENFDALSGHWWSRYVLSVSEAVADQATMALQQLVEQTSGGDDEAASTLDPPEEEFSPLEEAFEDGAGVNWVPIILTLAAGSVVFWGVRKLHDQPRAILAAPIRLQHNELWDYVSEDEPAPFVQHLEDGRGRRELRFEPDRRRIVIREDRDGDGRYEKEFSFID